MARRSSSSSRSSSGSDFSSSAAIGTEIRSLETDVRGLQKEMGGEFEHKVKTGEGRSGIGAMWERAILWSPTRIREIEAAVRELQEKQKEKDGEEIKSPVTGSGIVLDERGRLSALRLSVKELDTKISATKIEEKIEERKKKDKPSAATVEMARSQVADTSSMIQPASADAVNTLPNNGGQRSLA